MKNTFSSWAALVSPIFLAATLSGCAQKQEVTKEEPTIAEKAVVLDDTIRKPTLWLVKPSHDQVDTIMKSTDPLSYQIMLDDITTEYDKLRAWADSNGVEKREVYSMAEGIFKTESGEVFLQSGRGLYWAAFYFDGKSKPVEIMPEDTEAFLKKKK